MRRYALKWEVGHTNDPGVDPEVMVHASVPGAAQLDWANAEGWPEYWKAENCEQFGWMESVYWIYRTIIQKPGIVAKERLFFRCEGVDYQFLVKINGVVEHGQEGMFTPVAIDLTDKVAEGDQLEVVIFPAPDSGDYSQGRSEANASVKPAVGYGWDFHPRLVSSGIWKDTYLEIRNEEHIVDAELNYWVEEDLSRVHLDLTVELNRPSAGSIQWVLTNSKGEVEEAQSVAIEGQRVIAMNTELFDPYLWWPNGLGKQNMYRLTLSLHDEAGESVSRVKRRIGFRRVRLVHNPQVWDEPSAHPKGRSVPPMTLEVNGATLFCKGANWTPPEIFPGIIGEDTYRPLLEKAKGAHFNMLRCWGGGVVNKDSFFDLCDEMGIMIWQEFPLACNRYVDSPEYLNTLDQESRSIIGQLKVHPSVALWCGGNELFNASSKMSDQHKALRLLNRNCYDLDPETPFLPTSPIMGVGHGGYLFRDMDGVECLERIQNSRFTAYVEFGCSGVSPANYLKTFIPEEELFPVRPEGSWKRHHGLEAWDQEPGSWLCLDTIVDYFGRPESLEELTQYGQILQSEGYKAIYEEARRQKPYCSMALCWCFNEPWPTAANNSLINWPCEPKPAYESVKQSCRPILASARVSKFSWKGGEAFEAELWILNDSGEAQRGGTVEAYLQLDDEERFALAWDFESLDPNENLMGPTARVVLPRIEGQTFQLILRVESRREWNSRYTFCFKNED